MKLSINFIIAICIIALLGLIIYLAITMYNCSNESGFCGKNEEKHIE